MKHKLLTVSAVVVALAVTVWLIEVRLHAAGEIGLSIADPAFIAVNTPTSVKFTSVVADSSLRKHDPKKVLLIRTDSAGNPIGIVGRMLDDGKSGDATRNDYTYTLQTTLSEPIVGSIQFKVAAKFKQSGTNDSDGDDDWDGDLAALNATNDKNQRRDQLSKLLRRLKRYTLSDPIVVTVRMPTITWSTSTLDLTLAPGETDTRSVTVTSDTSISNVQIEAVPAIAPFLTIQPNSISTLPANQPGTVQISFNIPQSATVGTYDGTIHVRLGMQTLPQTLKLTVRLWNALSDPSFGISLEYPPNLTRIDQTNQNVIGLSTAAEDHEGVVGLWIYKIDNDAGLSPAVWWATTRYAAPSQRIAPRTLAGGQAIEVTMDPDGFAETHVVLQHLDKLYDIFIDVDPSTAERILSSIRF